MLREAIKSINIDQYPDNDSRTTTLRIIEKPPRKMCTVESQDQSYWILKKLSNFVG